MTIKNRLGWLASALGAATLTFSMAACGDDGMDPNPVPDGSPGMDACEGHACAPSGTVTELPEVGLLRAELYDFGPGADGNRVEALGAWAFFFENQDPAARPIVGLPIDDLGTVAGFTCFDNREGNALVNGYSDRNQEIVNSRDYFDIGPSIQLEHTGDGEPIVLTKYTAEVDGDEARDPTNQLLHDVIYKSELSAAAALERNTTYNLPVLPPDASGFPGLDLRGGYDIPGGADFRENTPTLYVPPSFTLGDEDAFYGADGAGNVEGFMVDPSQDLTMSWTINDDLQIPDGWPTVAQFTAFASVNAEGRPKIEYMCIGASATGSHTIPAALFAKEGFPQAGMVLHGMFAHVAWATPMSDGEEGHFGFLGVNCKLGPFQLNVQ